MISLVQLILEKKGDNYAYGCAMLDFNFPQMKSIHSKIDDEDLYTEEGDRTFAKETEPHITLLYGLHPEVTFEEVKDKLKDIKFTDLVIHKPSLFENEKYDVLKFDVTYPTKGGAFLTKANAALKELPFTSDFPKYHAHVTIAYVKPGLGKKYTEMFKDQEYKITPTKIVYSNADGTKKNIQL